MADFIVAGSRCEAPDLLELVAIATERETKGVRVAADTAGLRRARDLAHGGRLLHEAAKFFDRFGTVVHLQPKDGVVMKPNAAVLLHDDHRRRFLTTRVAAGELSALE